MMPPVMYFTPPPSPQQPKKHKNPPSNCFLQGLRFLYSGRHRTKVQTTDVFLAHAQYTTLADVFKER